MALRRLLPGTSAALGLVAATLMLLPGPAGANGPTKYGWWYEANGGLPVAPPAPPQVPSDGLYIENGFSGPTAISALTFTVPSGAALGPMTLKIAGTPTMTQAPIACAVSPASAGYQSAEDGSWKDRPSFDCKKAQSAGAVDSGRTTVAFNVDSFLANGTVAVVILAGGSADRVALQKPDAGALQVTSGDSGAGVRSNPAISDNSGQASGLTSQPSPVAGGSPLPLIDTGAGVAGPGPSATTATAGPPGGPPAATPSGSGSLSGSPSSERTNPVNATTRQSWRTQLAMTSGSIAVLLALVAWTLGYGPLGGRVQPLSVRLHPPSRQPETNGTADDRI
jgi:hypothetical protein